MRVLIWPTDPMNGIGLVESLRALGFSASATDATVDALVLDPHAVAVYATKAPSNAITFVRHARTYGARNCIMVLLATADHPGHRVSALAAGADDVQHWPLDVRELSARLKALAARDRAYADAPVPLPGGFYYRVTGHMVGENCTIHLTKAEHTVLELLVDRAGGIATKGAVMQALYQGRDEPHEKIVDVFICKLRKKLDPVTRGVDVIETVWGQGYRFVQQGFRPSQGQARLRAVAS